jgi:phenylacetate-CoA ligase
VVVMNVGNTNRLSELIRLAYELAPGWRQWFDQHGINPQEIETAEDLLTIPVLRKTELPRLQQAAPPFAGLYVGAPERIFLSPGPIYDPQPAGEDPWRFSTPLAHAGFGSDDIVLNTFSYHLSPAGFMFDKALRTLGASVAPTGVGNTELLVQMLRELRVTGYTGTPSYLRSLLQRAEETGMRFGEEIHLRKAFFTAEPLPPDFANWCRERGIAFGEAYGTADAGCVAYRKHDEQGLQLEANVLVQICDPQTGELLADGEVGELVITVFDHQYPLIRFGTGDLSRWLPGESERKIAGVLGRVGDGVKVRGMFVYRQQMEQVLAQYPEVDYFQADVFSHGGKDVLQISLETTGSSMEGLLETIGDNLRQILRVKAELRTVAPGSLDRSRKILEDQRSKP